MSDVSPSSSAAAGARGDAHHLGVALMLGGVATVPLIDLFAKALGQGYFGAEGAPPLWVVGEPMAPMQIAWGRLLMQVALLAPVVALVTPGGFRIPRRFGLVALRGALFAFAAVAFFTALRYLGLAEAIAIFFVEPLILTVLSALFLGERIGWRRVAAISVGLVGAALIIQPNFVEVGWAALLPLLAALCFAVYLILTRMLARDQSTVALQLWTGLVGFAVASAIMGAGAVAETAWLAPIAIDARHWLVFLGMGVIGATSHVVIAAAFRYVEASVLAPLQYFEIFGAALLGWLVFDETLDQATLIGLGLIVGSGVFVLRRERRLKEAGAREIVHPIAPPKRQ